MCLRIWTFSTRWIKCLKSEKQLLISPHLWSIPQHKKTCYIGHLYKPVTCNKSTYTEQTYTANSCEPYSSKRGLTFKHIMMTFNDPEKEAFWKHSEKNRKFRIPAFSPFPIIFSILKQKNSISWGIFKMMSTNAFNSDQSKFLSFGKELVHLQVVPSHVSLHRLIWVETFCYLLAFCLSMELSTSKSVVEETRRLSRDN